MSALAAWLYCQENTDAYEYLLEYGKYLMPSYALEGILDKIVLLSEL